MVSMRPFGGRRRVGAVFFVDPSLISHLNLIYMFKIASDHIQWSTWNCIQELPSKIYNSYSMILQKIGSLGV